MAELADALDLGSSSLTGVQVRVLSAPLATYVDPTLLPNTPILNKHVIKTYGGGVSQDMLMSDPRVATIGNYYSATSHANSPQLAERTRHPARAFP